jgi:hypothetical protein
VVGGTVVAKVVVHALEDPIGWIVSSPADVTPDEPPKAAEAKLWHFVPARGIVPILSGGTRQIALYDAVRGQCERICNLLAPDRPNWRTIASGDDRDIENRVLEWCGMMEAWVGGGLDERFSFWSDVLEMCDHFDSESREWEGGGPGLSGVWFKVRTNNPKALKQEIADLIKELASRPPPPPPPPKKRRRTAKTRDCPKSSQPGNHV